MTSTVRVVCASTAAVISVAAATALIGTKTHDSQSGRPDSSPAAGVGTRADVVVADDQGLRRLSVVTRPEAAARVTAVEPLPVAGAVVSPTVSPDGRLVYVAVKGENTDLMIADADGSAATLLTDTRETDETGPTWSPDGTQLAFVRTDARGKPEIVVMDASTGREQQVTNNDVVDLGPAWSPDGDRLVFSRTDDEGTDLYAYSLAEKAEVRLTQSPDLEESSPTVAPDGSSIAYLMPDDAPVDPAAGDAAPLARGRAIWVLEEGSEPRRLTPAGQLLEPEWVTADTLVYSQLSYPVSRVAMLDVGRPERPTTLYEVTGIPTFSWRERS